MVIFTSVNDISEREGGFLVDTVGGVLREAGAHVVVVEAVGGPGRLQFQPAYARRPDVAGAAEDLDRDIAGHVEDVHRQGEDAEVEFVDRRGRVESDGGWAV